MRRAWFLCAWLSACYAPHPQPGSPCAFDHPCPDPLVCSALTQTCETTPAGGGDDATPADGPLDGGGLPDAFVLDNDLPSGATPITGTGTITEDVTSASDDAAPPANNGCGAAGGRDVFFMLQLAADEVWYLDTFGSTYDTVIRTYPGPCHGGAAPNGTVCRNNACGVSQSQLAVTFPAGNTCIVIDEDGPGSGNAMLVLHVERGNRDGTRLNSGTAQVATGNTCTSPKLEAGSCGGSGREDGYYTTVCPNGSKSLTASTCDPATTFDTVLYVRGPGATELACNNDNSACATPAGTSALTGVTLAGPHLFWLLVDGLGDADCGAYSLTTTLQ